MRTVIRSSLLKKIERRDNWKVNQRCPCPKRMLRRRSSVKLVTTMAAREAMITMEAEVEVARGMITVTEVTIMVTAMRKDGVANAVNVTIRKAAVTEVVVEAVTDIAVTGADTR